MKMDDFDRQIIDRLMKNARISFRKIARDLGVSPMTVVKRVKKMEEAGYIRGYTVLLDYSKVKEACKLCIMVRVKSGFRAENVGREISKLRGCISVNYVTGNFDLAIIAVCKGKEGIGEFLSKLSSIEGVERADSHLVIKEIKPGGD